MGSAGAKARSVEIHRDLRRLDGWVVAVSTAGVKTLQKWSNDGSGLFLDAQMLMGPHMEGSDPHMERSGWV